MKKAQMQELDAGPVMYELIHIRMVIFMNNISVNHLQTYTL